MNLITIIPFSILVESLIQYFKTVGKAFSDKNYKAFTTQLFSIILGIALAFAFNGNIFPYLNMPVNPTIGLIISGIIISRGSNYVSDLIKKLTPSEGGI